MKFINTHRLKPRISILGIQTAKPFWAFFSISFVLFCPLCKLAEQLFNGDKSYTGVTYQLEELLRQAKKDWPEATKTID